VKPVGEAQFCLVYLASLGVSTSWLAFASAGREL
jgi:hypothetical protein